MSEKGARYKCISEAWTTGHYACALELSRDYLRDFPDDFVAWLLQGVLLTELARYAEAEQSLHAAIHGCSLEILGHCYLRLGNLHREKGEYDEAEVWYRKALERNPDHGNVHVILGALLAQKGEYPAAEQCHRAAIRCAKEDVKDEAYLNLGLVLRAQERYAEAHASFSQAIELTPNYADAIAARQDVERAMAYLQSRV